MAYIYKITNKINGKSYIGKTELAEPKKRFKRHILDSRKEACKNRPLYRAFNKYGVDNFELQILEESENVSGLEVYYIEKYNTYGNKGYNATKGGDGKKLFDYKAIEDLIIAGLTTREITKKLNCGKHTVRNVAKAKQITLNVSKNGLQLQMEASKKTINQLSLEGKYIQTFDSYADAARWLKQNNYSTGAESGIRQKIGLVCNGKRVTAFKFKWEFKK